MLTRALRHRLVHIAPDLRCGTLVDPGDDDTTHGRYLTIAEVVRNLEDIELPRLRHSSCPLPVFYSVAVVWIDNSRSSRVAIMFALRERTGSFRLYHAAEVKLLPVDHEIRVAADAARAHLDSPHPGPVITSAVDLYDDDATLSYAGDSDGDSDGDDSVGGGSVDLEHDLADMPAEAVDVFVRAMDDAIDIETATERAGESAAERDGESATDGGAAAAPAAADDGEPRELNLTPQPKRRRRQRRRRQRTRGQRSPTGETPDPKRQATDQPTGSSANETNVPDSSDDDTTAADSDAADFAQQQNRQQTDPNVHTGLNAEDAITVDSTTSSEHSSEPSSPEPSSPVPSSPVVRDVDATADLDQAADDPCEDVRTVPTSEASDQRPDPRHLSPRRVLDRLGRSCTEFVAATRRRSTAIAASTSPTSGPSSGWLRLFPVLGRRDARPEQQDDEQDDKTPASTTGRGTQRGKHGVNQQLSIASFFAKKPRGDVVTEPVDESSEPVDVSSEPVDASSEPVDESSEPADMSSPAPIAVASSEPVVASSEPVDTSSEPADESSEPVVASSPAPIADDSWLLADDDDEADRAPPVDDHDEEPAPARRHVNAEGVTFESNGETRFTLPINSESLHRLYMMHKETGPDEFAQHKGKGGQIHTALNRLFAEEVLIAMFGSCRELRPSDPAYAVIHHKSRSSYRICGPENFLVRISTATSTSGSKTNLALSTNGRAGYHPDADVDILVVLFMTHITAFVNDEHSERRVQLTYGIQRAFGVAAGLDTPAKRTFENAVRACVKILGKKKDYGGYRLVAYESVLSIAREQPTAERVFVLDADGRERGGDRVFFFKGAEDRIEVRLDVLRLWGDFFLFAIELKLGIIIERFVTHTENERVSERGGEVVMRSWRAACDLWRREASGEPLRGVECKSMTVAPWGANVYRAGISSLRASKVDRRWRILVEDDDGEENDCSLCWCLAVSTGLWVVADIRDERLHRLLSMGSASLQWRTKRGDTYGFTFTLRGRTDYGAVERFLASCGLLDESCRTRFVPWAEFAQFVSPEQLSVMGTDRTFSIFSQSGYGYLFEIFVANFLRRYGGPLGFVRVKPRGCTEHDLKIYQMVDNREVELRAELKLMRCTVRWMSLRDCKFCFEALYIFPERFDCMLFGLLYPGSFDFVDATSSPRSIGKSNILDVFFVKSAEEIGFGLSANAGHRGHKFGLGYRATSMQAARRHFTVLAMMHCWRYLASFTIEAREAPAATALQPDAGNYAPNMRDIAPAAVAAAAASVSR